MKLDDLNTDELNNNAEQKDKELRQFVFIGYILQAVFFVFVVTPIFGMIINFIKKDDLLKSRYHSHYRWQQNTFWYGLLWMFLSVMTYFFLIGFVVFFFLGIWYIYRIVKGWLYLVDGKELY